MICYDHVCIYKCYQYRSIDKCHPCQRLLFSNFRLSFVISLYSSYCVLILRNYYLYNIFRKIPLSIIMFTFVNFVKRFHVLYEEYMCFSLKLIVFSKICLIINMLSVLDFPFLIHV